MISKKVFCDIIENLRKANDADQLVDQARVVSFSEFLGSDMSYLASDVLVLMTALFDLDEDLLPYFCYELDFGRKKGSNHVNLYATLMAYERATDVNLSSAEKLYEFVIAFGGK